MVEAEGHALSVCLSWLGAAQSFLLEGLLKIPLSRDSGGEALAARGQGEPVPVRASVFPVAQRRSLGLEAVAGFSWLGKKAETAAGWHALRGSVTEGKRLCHLEAGKGKTHSFIFDLFELLPSPLLLL